MTSREFHLKERGTDYRPDFWSNWVILALFAYATVPAFLENFSRGQISVAVNVEVESTPIGAFAQELLLASVIVVCVGATVHGFRKARLGPWFVVYMLPWVAASVSSALNESRLSYTSLVYPVVGIIFAGSSNFLSNLRTIGVLTVCLSAFSIALGVMAPAAALWPEVPPVSKALFGTSLLAGPLNHPNTLGQALALGIPFISLLRKKFGRRVGFLLSGLALLWSGSRTSMIASIIGLGLAWLLIRASSASPASRPWFRLATICSVFGVVITGPILVLVSNVGSFTGRGKIWAGSFEYLTIADSWVVGLGPRFYADSTVDQLNVLGSGAFHGHSMLVNLVATCGFAGVATGAVVFFALSKRILVVRGRGSIAPQILAICWFGIVFVADCWLEVPTDFYTPGSLVWVAWPALALSLAPLTTRQLSKTPGLAEANWPK